jgi:hypothetical protein
MSKFAEENNTLINLLTDITGRHPRQTEFLLELLDDNFEDLLILEEKIKNNFIYYCPGNKEEIKKILLMGDKSKQFNLDSFKNIKII